MLHNGFPTSCRMTNSRTHTIAFGVALLAATASACGAARARRAELALEQATTVIYGAADEASDAGYEAAMLAATGEASAALHLAAAHGDDTPALLRAALEVTIAADDVAATAAIAEVAELSAEVPTDLVLLIGTETVADQFDVARLRARQAVRDADSEEDRGAFTRALYATFLADTELFPPVTDWDRNIHGNEFRDFAQASSVLFRVKLGEDTVAVFKPMQSVRHSNYRGEVASYRLCEIIGCNVVIPHNRELRIHEDDFMLATDIDEFEDHRRFQRRNSDLVWHTDEAGDRWLYGTYKDWIPGFCRFPLEWEGVWHRYVRVGRTVEELQGTSIDYGLAPLLALAPTRYADILERKEDATMYDLAWQMSDLHVLDYLANNHDRRLPDEPRYGMNLQFDEGTLVSIDNGASFRTDEDHDSRETWRHLQRVSVFSRDIVDNLRWMDDDAMYDALFPESAYHPDSRERYAFFLQRRDDLVEYVDGLVAEHGESAVYLFP